MKLSEVMKFSPERRPGPVVVRQSMTNKETAIAYVDTNPGASYLQAKKDIGKKSADLLYGLANRSLLVSRKLDGVYRFYPASYKAVATPKKPVKLRKNGTAQQMIVAYIQNNPGTDIQAITDHLGWKSTNSARTTLIKLEKRGYVRRSFEDSRYRYFTTYAQDTPALPTPTQEATPSQSASLREQAQAYAWDNPEDFTAIRNFINWMEERHGN